MRLFTRFLALWFLLFTLMSSTAWACAEYPELVASTAGFAQENLMLAKAALEQGNSHQARVLLAEVDENLDAYTKDVDKIRKQAIAELRKEMKALSADLDNKANSNSLAKTCEGCWNRISELVG